VEPEGVRAAGGGQWAGAVVHREPNLYRLLTTVEAAGAAVDQYETPFGIRSARFDAEKGFFLNGQPVKIKGTCCHQDHGGVGSALPDRIQYFRIEKLKEMESNGLRTSHNPPAPELMDACDKLGMVVDVRDAHDGFHAGRPEPTGAHDPVSPEPSEHRRSGPWATRSPSRAMSAARASSPP